MSMTANGWKNKSGTSDRKCGCGSWKNHWINCSGKSWPKNCSVNGCANDADRGLHIINSQVSGEYIVPGCASCNSKSGEFNLNGGVTLVSANKQNTCEQ